MSSESFYRWKYRYDLHLQTKKAIYFTMLWLVTLHTTGAPEIEIDQFVFSGRGKFYLSDIRCLQAFILAPIVEFNILKRISRCSLN